MIEQTLYRINIILSLCGSPLWMYTVSLRVRIGKYVFCIVLLCYVLCVMYLFLNTCLNIILTARRLFVHDTSYVRIDFFLFNLGLICIFFCSPTEWQH